MKKEFFTIRETIELLDIDEGFIATLEKEQIISCISEGEGNDRLLACSEVEKLKVAKTLINDMDVNLPGVEVILNMRETMIEMRRQFDEILKDLADEVRGVIEGRRG